MFETGIRNLDKIMTTAQYHQECLGAIAEGLKERESKLRQKCAQFITQDFSAVVVPVNMNVPVKDVSEVF